MAFGARRRSSSRLREMELLVGQLRSIVEVKDPTDVTPWQRGYRACADRVAIILDVIDQQRTCDQIGMRRCLAECVGNHNLCEVKR